MAADRRSNCRARTAGSESRRAEVSIPVGPLFTGGLWGHSLRVACVGPPFTGGLWGHPLRVAVRSARTSARLAPDFALRATSRSRRSASRGGGCEPALQQAEHRCFRLREVPWLAGGAPRAVRNGLHHRTI